MKIFFILISTSYAQNCNCNGKSSDEKLRCQSGKCESYQECELQSWEKTDGIVQQEMKCGSKYDGICTLNFLPDPTARSFDSMYQKVEFNDVPLVKTVGYGHFWSGFEIYLEISGTV